MEPDPTASLESLVDTLAPNSRVLGLDLGSKRIGLALSDVSRTVATPMKTLKRAKFAQNAKELLDIAEEHEIGAFIIGLPINLDGSEGPAAQSARAFVRNLAAKTDIPIALWDERLSTAAVERTLLDADTSRKRRAEVIDKMAAAYILQGALDRLNTI
ncbi:putative pre-16S rRNA nuclease [bacterium MnTg02]|nr:putative pre-16S rRNA nuclease [bacterium MnTg02]